MTDWGPLGEVLARERSDRNRANVEELVAHAKDLLKLVRDTFPTYTMHDEQHARNVIGLMGDLAAPRIDVMRPLEAALLILAAYFHDAGMAYSADELSLVPDEEEFRAFLDIHDEAYLATQRNGGTPPATVVEQYCRSRHADRVRLHLERCDRTLLQWDRRPIIDALELICRSHNEPTAALHEPRFKTDFMYGADLRFCAIMLRLADILDLDDTRAPAVIYEHLNLARHATPEAATSDREWRKHLVGRGFAFPPRQVPNYTLQFVAEPDSPGVEHDLRTFLGVIEEELLQSRGVVDVCGDRWRGLPLPAEIDTSTITSNGYKYGEFRFELDRTAVLELFTGEQLYDDPYAFIRELLQNALDAIRARTHLYAHESRGVRVYCWEDVGGYLWVRVDDDGIGMDEEALRNYFLRVGRSYYRSAAFEAELARSGLADRPFGVISRFGIGVLSCFMVGDRVEVSSRRVGGGRAVRLSIDRRDDYFVLQEQGMAVTAMPGKHGDEPGLPGGPGTRIAVRIDPNRTGVTLDEMRAGVEKYVFAPPVPVLVDGRDVGLATSLLVDEPPRPAPMVIDIDHIPLSRHPGRSNEAAERPFLPYLGPLRVAVVPLDLGRVSESRDVRGQLVVYVPLLPEGPELQDLLAGWPARDVDVAPPLLTAVAAMQINMMTDTYDGAVDIHVTRALRAEQLRKVATLLETKATPIQEWGYDWAAQDHWPDSLHLRRPSADLDVFVRHHANHLNAWTESVTTVGLGDLAVEAGFPASPLARSCQLGYNGIALPVGSPRSDFTLRSPTGLAFGAISLSGDLRPDLTVSRSRMRGLAFPIRSAIHLAIRRACREQLPAHDVPAPVIREVAETTVSSILTTAANVPAAEYWADPLLRSGAWNGEPVITTTAGRESVADLRARNILGPSSEISVAWPTSPLFLHESEFYSTLQLALLHFFVDVEWRPLSVGTNPRTSDLLWDIPVDGELLVTSSASPERHPQSLHLPLLFAVPYRADRDLARTGRGAPLNARHPLAGWLLDHADELTADFPAPFEQSLRPLTSVEAVNKALDQVARARPRLTPPTGAYLRKDENGWWWSR
ncbi:ATP-binding protein [Actinoplanes sp. M2I2]|uniref:HD domain-containing protein n=1 Tax=Actinoplanes sp. M2I2 TaxID=1734444 RepID=UPI0020227B4E|nr:ATP-binding protein [Actinoplanes sp. M2I2]